MIRNIIAITGGDITLVGQSDNGVDTIYPEFFGTMGANWENIKTPFSYEKRERIYTTWSNNCEYWVYTLWHKGNKAGQVLKKLNHLRDPCKGSDTIIKVKPSYRTLVNTMVLVPVKLKHKLKFYELAVKPPKGPSGPPNKPLDENRMVAEEDTFTEFLRTG